MRKRCWYKLVHLAFFAQFLVFICAKRSAFHTLSNCCLPHLATCRLPLAWIPAPQDTNVEYDERFCLYMTSRCQEKWDRDYAGAHTQHTWSVIGLIGVHEKHLDIPLRSIEGYIWRARFYIRTYTYTYTYIYIYIHDDTWLEIYIYIYMYQLLLGIYRCFPVSSGKKQTFRWNGWGPGRVAKASIDVDLCIWLLKSSICMSWWLNPRLMVKSPANSSYLRLVWVLVFSRLRLPNPHFSPELSAKTTAGKPSWFQRGKLTDIICSFGACYPKNIPKCSSWWMIVCCKNPLRMSRNLGPATR